MVERLKAAIEKARAMRAEGSKPQSPAQPAPAAAPRAEAASGSWDALAEFIPDPAHMRRERIVTFGKTDPMHVVFDMLRTRLLRACVENGWRRIAITSPSPGCGKSVLCGNLAFSIARNSGASVLLVDLDLKMPHVATLLGMRGEHDITEMLRGGDPVSRHAVRIGRNLAVVANTRSVPDSAELMHSPATRVALDAAVRLLDPDILLFDMPPMLVGDDVLAIVDQIDALILVVAADHTKASEIMECERLLGGATNFLGVVLNKCREEDEAFPGASAYAYAYS